MKNGKTRILFVVQDLEIGGAEQLKLTIEKYIDKKRYDTTYCCIKNTGAIGEEISRIGGKVIFLNTIDNFYNFIATVKLYRLARRLKPDMIHSMLFNANFHARLVGIMLDIPVIIEEHGLYVWKRWYHIIIDRILSNFTKKVIAVSRSVKDFLIKQENLDPNKVIVIYDCVDPNFLMPAVAREEARGRIGIKDDTFVIGTVGNLREEKGHRILLHAMKQALTERKGMKLFIAGDGPLYGYLKEQAGRLKIEDNVVFLKKISDVPGFLRALDLFVLPSTSEGLGIALIEAVAAGLPCVASNVGGIKEVAEGCESVLLIDPNNPIELGRAIIGQIENVNFKNSASAGPEAGSIKNIFLPQVYLENLEAVYSEVLNK